VLKLGLILGDLDVDRSDPKAVTAAKARAMPLWTQEYKLLPAQLRDNPTVQALSTNYEGGVSRFLKNYGHLVEV
jgi:hypothetical protein